MALRQKIQGGKDLVITDLIMPKLGGDGLAKVIKQIDPTMPLILLTGYVDRPVDGERSPFDMVISKPFRYDTIHAAIASIQLGKGV
jgi:CheY-like chemotaxis protein